MNARHKDEEQSLESLLSDSLSAVLGLVLTLRSRAPAAALLSLIPTYDLSQVGSKVESEMFIAAFVDEGVVWSGCSTSKLLSCEHNPRALLARLNLTALEEKEAIMHLRVAE